MNTAVIGRTESAERTPRIGILAFGSLIDDTGDAIRVATESQIETETPFNVEFARKSDKRFGGPTLIRVPEGGGPVKAVIFLLRDTVTREEAQTMLWLRETGKMCGDYDRPLRPGPNYVLIESIENLCDIEVVLYTSIRENIDPLTVERLAQLAIQSARAEV